VTKSFVPRLSVVVPAHNEELNLRGTVGQVAQSLERLGCAFEVIVVDDGSTDRTAEVVESLGQSDGRIRLSSNRANFGIARSFSHGASLARGEWVILIPADLAMDPLQIGEFLAAGESADIVVGLRSDRRDSSRLRRLVSQLNIVLIRILFRMPQRQFNFVTMYRRVVLSRLEIQSSSVFFHAEILIKARDMGYRISELNIRYVPRLHGKTSTSHPRVIVAAIREMLGFWWSWRPRKANVVE
jgi:glycosyltransferase involved in cell wall biosynthesis